MERVSAIVRTALALIFAALVVGCSAGSQSTATKEEEQHFRNPSKTPPPEAGFGAPPSPGGK